MKHSDTFAKLLTKSIREFGLPNRTKASIEWFRDQGKAVQKINRKEFIRDQHGRQAITPAKSWTVGDMVLFNYDPKWKHELPVYDTHPLIFPFRILKDRFYGLNMHYLPHAKRAQLMDALDTVKNNNRYDQSTKLRLSWKIIKEVAKREDYAVTVHCYLKRHVKSKMKLILPQEWNYVLTLPLAVWRGPEADLYRQNLK